MKGGRKDGERSRQITQFRRLSSLDFAKEHNPSSPIIFSPK